MKFLWATINVRDMAESVKFYEALVGLALERKFPIEGGEIVFLGSGETKIELIYDGTDKWEKEKTGIALGFKTHSLQGKMEEIKKEGYELVGGPFYPSPNIGFFYVEDPNGVRVQFVEEK